MNKIVQPLLEFRNQIKIYHWSTESDPRHKNSDKLLSEIDELSDKFVEVLSGSRDKKPNSTMTLSLKKMTDTSILKYIENFRFWLGNDLVALLYEDETDLLNLKDELISTVNRGLYLLRNK